MNETWAVGTPAVRGSVYWYAYNTEQSLLVSLLYKGMSMVTPSVKQMSVGAAILRESFFSYAYNIETRLIIHLVYSKCPSVNLYYGARLLYCHGTKGFSWYMSLQSLLIFSVTLFVTCVTFRRWSISHYDSSPGEVFIFLSLMYVKLLINLARCILIWAQH